MSLVLDDQRRATTGRALSVGSGYRRDLQGLRALAVTLLVLNDARVPGVRAGSIGLDVCYVISGFLIASNTFREVRSSGRLSVSAFYARRMRRLLPPVSVVVLATLVVAQWRGLWGAEPLPLDYVWQLAPLALFYLAWPLTSVVALLVARRFYEVALGVVTVGVVMTCVAEGAASTRPGELGLGVALAIGASFLARIHSVVRGVLTWIGIAAVVGSALVGDSRVVDTKFLALIAVAGCALLIVGGGGSKPWRGAGVLLEVRPAQLVGRVSYSWYLWHWPMIVFAPSVLGHSLSWIRNVEISLLALWLAGLTYAVVERPIQRRVVSSRDSPREGGSP